MLISILTPITLWKIRLKSNYCTKSDRNAFVNIKSLGKCPDGKWEAGVNNQALPDPKTDRVQNKYWNLFDRISDEIETQWFPGFMQRLEKHDNEAFVAIQDAFNKVETAWGGDFRTFNRAVMHLKTVCLQPLENDPWE